MSIADSVIHQLLSQLNLTFSIYNLNSSQVTVDDFSIKPGMGVVQ